VGPADGAGEASPLVAPRVLCDARHDVQLDMGYCQHLEIGGAEAARRFHYRIYGTEGLPELCAQYSCVSGAKARGEYDERNAMLGVAQRALDALGKP
jgi:hypothetical protein